MQPNVTIEAINPAPVPTGQSFLGILLGKLSFAKKVRWGSMSEFHCRNVAPNVFLGKPSFTPTYSTIGQDIYNAFCLHLNSLCKVTVWPPQELNSKCLQDLSFSTKVAEKVHVVVGTISEWTNSVPGLSRLTGEAERIFRRTVVDCSTDGIFATTLLSVALAGTGLFYAVKHGKHGIDEYRRGKILSGSCKLLAAATLTALSVRELWALSAAAAAWEASDLIYQRIGCEVIHVTDNAEALG